MVYLFTTKKKILTGLFNLSVIGFSQAAGDFYKRATVKFKAGDYAGAAFKSQASLLERKCHIISNLIE